jgi:uncharacterized membrane protein YfcA
VLQRLYGVFLIYTGWRFIEPRRLWAYQRTRVFQPPDMPEVQLAWYVLFGVGLAAGVASGLFGIGGGLVIVPVLVALLHMTRSAPSEPRWRRCCRPSGWAGEALSFYQADKIDLAAAACIAAGLVFGAFAGARIALGLPSAPSSALYGLFLIAVSLRFLFQL